MKSLDLIGAIELAYDRGEADEAKWLAEVTRTIAPAYGVEGPTASYVFDIADKNVHLGTTVSHGDDNPLNRQQFERSHDVGGSQVAVTSVYECAPYTLLSRVVGPKLAKESITGGGMVGEDALGLRANATPTSGVLVMSVLQTTNHRIKNRELWSRFAAHLGTALRLRRARKEFTADAAPAVLTPDGKLAQGTSEIIAQRSAFADAAKAIDRARGKMRRLDPETATALWRTMVQGEWSLVDWYDHDGKRFLLAQENRVPATGANRTLTAREEQVVACAAMGHSNKLIAYDLGLSTGTVAVLLGRAARKLGVNGRVALVRVFRESYQR